MLQLNLKSQVPYAEWGTPVATDLLQLALPEKNPA